MNFSFSNQVRKKDYLYYSLLFIFLAACVFGSYLVLGHTFLWTKDVLNQHLPLLAEYRRAVIEWFHHPTTINQWSWKMGLGTDTFSVFSYYNIGDLFAYIALLFPAAKITTAFSVISVLRMYCVGLAFVYFCQHFNFRPTTVMIGTCTYLVNAFLLYACIAQPFFTTPFIIFPLLVVQIERVLQGGRVWPLTLVFTWMLISNYYLAFILAIGAMMFLVIRVLTYYRKGLNYPLTIAKLALATITSLMLSAVMWIPELLAVMNSTRVGATFANGLKTYPLYYYLFLPKQLINGGQWSFMFWTALGIVSIGFIAIAYVYLHARQYPLLTISLGIAFIMLLIPAVGAVLNGMMAASNRWTLLIYLPLALTVCILVEHAPTIDRRTMNRLTLATLIYLVVLIITFIFQGDDDILLPIAFLLLSLMGLWAVNLQLNKYALPALVTIVALNAGANAIFSSLPYNGDFSSAMLTRGEYSRLTRQRYGGLDKGLPTSYFYRVSTISQNQIIANKLLDNDLTSSLHIIDSYYSLQNRYLGQFNDSLQNNQTTANIPIRQADDRSVLNHFYGAKYLFVQSDGLNAEKIPAGYHLDKQTDPIYNYDKGQPSTAKSKQDLIPIQTNRYRTADNFPLLYWQNSYISQHRYRQLSPTEKERALAAGVVVNGNQKATRNMQPAQTKRLVVPIKTQLISNRFNKINPEHLKYTDSTEKYHLQLKLTAAQRRALAGSELHLEFAKIKFTPFTMKEQIKYEQAHLKQMATNPGSIVNMRGSKYQYWRYHVLNGAPDLSYKINVGSRYGTETIQQYRQSTLSFFKMIRHTTLNLGYYRGSLPQQLSFQPTKLGTYQLKYRLVAEKLDDNYYQQVHELQSHALTDLHFANNQISGNITTTQAGILTSSIPYSKGWSARVDGHSVPVLRTNQAFVGLRLPTGRHHVQLTYQTPGLKTGALVSLIGLGWTLVIGIIALWLAKRKQ